MLGIAPRTLYVHGIQAPCHSSVYLSFDLFFIISPNKNKSHCGYCFSSVVGDSSVEMPAGESRPCWGLPSYHLRWGDIAAYRSLEQIDALKLGSTRIRVSSRVPPAEGRQPVCSPTPGLCLLPVQMSFLSKLALSHRYFAKTSDLFKSSWVLC